jgi:hypothetical protein
MARCPFAQWKPISGSSGPYVTGPFKIVHHTTEGGTADGAMAAFAAHRSDPHFTVDRSGIFQHIDTGEGARALRNEPGGVETNRASAVQIELVGFAHLPKHPKALEHLARLCRWIEATHGVARTWPAGRPKPAKDGHDPGGHRRDVDVWRHESGHFGHCHVPENTHWDPGFSAEEADFVLSAQFGPEGELVSHAGAALPAGRSGAGAGAGTGRRVSTMPDHGIGGEEAAAPAPKAPRPSRKKPAPAVEQAAPERIYNVRADTLDFRDRMYVPALIEVPTEKPLKDYLQVGVPLLDQGKEGACTGYALATVANYLLLKRKVRPDPQQVSPRMLYDLARRYDEWPGEHYSGSSARGAMKGWNKHGVCSELEYPSAPGGASPRLDALRTEEAKRRPLGAYFRVNHKDLIAMHSAIAEVGVLFATATVHAGWNRVGRDGIIPYSDQVLGGHAFAIVAYDEHGFWLQNSWLGWGKRQMGRISYDDWLENGTDVWVARLGAPVMLHKPISIATAHATTSGQSAAYTYADLRPHIVSVENEGTLKAGGDYGSTPGEIDAIFAEDIPRLLQAHEEKHLLLYAHGGLVDEESAVQRVSEYRPALLASGIYPLAFVWHSDYWTTVTSMLQDAIRRRRPEGFLDEAKDFMLDRLDDAIEPLARRLSGRASWKEMKENALLASAPGGAARLIVEHVAALKKRMPGLKIHLVGHSAGAILLAPLVQLLTSSGEIASGPMQGATGAGLTVTTCTLWAPACTTGLFRETYLPAILSSDIESFTQYSLNDQAERDDTCANIYHKSLLYLVSHALEDEERIPGHSPGTPIMGMADAIGEDSAIQDMFARNNAHLVLAPNNAPDDSISASKARAHGAFDDDLPTVMSTFKRILGGRAGDVVDQRIADTSVVFAHSAHSLMAKRVAIDHQTSR